MHTRDFIVLSATVLLLGSVAACDALGGKSDDGGDSKKDKKEAEKADKEADKKADEGKAAASATPPPPPCPGVAREFKALEAGSAQCTCAANPSGTVWGDKIYTTDSSICAAAVHAGVIPADKGGVVEAKKVQGCPQYVATQANGVSSQSWGSWESSFYFPAKGDGKCVAPPEDACPQTLSAVTDADGKECSCPGGATTGSVYGTGIYTTDSYVCRAAAHAGAVDAAKGGKVKIKTAPGCGKYVGTTANGVTTSDWGSYDSSYWFEGHGDGACAK